MRPCGHSYKHRRSVTWVVVYSHSGQDHTLCWVRNPAVKGEFDGPHVHLTESAELALFKSGGSQTLAGF
ncbi:MAG: hypothetical protein J07HR59_01727 [Halorubrum sp. J07HR59]|nr:MAG: hypothetical protein J07HR59_01727 [Halorubrum sp. J07HR59]